MKPEVVAELSKTVLAQRYDNYKPTPAFHYDLWELACLPHQKVAVAAPRGHAKTTAITGTFLIASVLFREAKYALVISDTEEQAAEFLTDIAVEFTDNDALTTMFNVKGLAKASQTDIIIEFKDGYKARILAKGAEQKIRGRKWLGARPDLIMVDDLENENLVESDSRREKLKRWFYGSVLPAGADDCIYRVVGTILHFDSLLESLMPDENDPNTVIEDLRTYNLEGDWISVKYQAHDDDFENILWPEKFDKKRLNAIEADYRRQGIPEVYSQEYRNVPLSDDNAFFEKRNFVTYEEEDIEDYWSCYAAADLAISERDRAAFTVITVGRMGPDGKIYIIDVIRGRWAADRIIDEFFAVQERYGPEVFWLEKENIARTLGPIFEREMQDRREYINLEGVIATKDKQSRARPLQARMRAGAVLFPKDAEWYPNFETEMRRFPKGAFADQVDSCGLLVSGIAEMSDPLTFDELEDQAYEDEFGDDMFIGRSLVTGY